MKTFGYDKEWPEIEICTETGAGTTSYFCDYYWMAEGGEVVFSGGHVNYGAIAGPFYRYCNYGAGSSAWNISGRPQSRK